MCGRFVIGDPKRELWEEWLGAAMPDPMPGPSWNVAPTQDAVILRRARDGARRAEVARWGLIPHWWKKPLSEMKASTFNARSEEASEKPMFRAAWAGARCLVPALGYYEWTGKAGAKQPWFVTLKTNAPGVTFAGLFARAEIEGETLLTFTILTTAAGEATRHLHPRTPVILTEGAWERWLDPETPDADLRAMMRPPEDDRVEHWPVDRAVGNTRNDGAHLVERQGLGI